MSSIKTTTKTSRYPCRASQTKCIKCEGALVTPNDITKNSNRPQRILNTIFGIYSSQIGIYQYPDFKFILLNTRAPPRWYIISLGNGKGYQFLIVFLLSQCQSIQNRRPLSFLGANSTGAPHGDSEDRMKPCSSMYSICLFASSSLSGLNLLIGRCTDLVSGSRSIFNS